MLNTKTWRFMLIAFIGTAFTALAEAYFIEFPVCVTQLAKAGVYLTNFDAILLFLALVGRILVICLPVFVLAGALKWCALKQGRLGIMPRKWLVRISWILVILLPSSLILYLLADAIAHSVFGNSIKVYLHFITDPKAWELSIGMVWYLLRASLFLIGIVLFQIFMLLLAKTLIGISANVIMHKPWIKRMHPSMVGVALVVALGLTFPVQLLASHKISFFVVQRTVPFDFWFAQKHFTRSKADIAFRKAFLPKIAKATKKYLHSVSLAGDKHIIMPNLKFRDKHKPNVVLIISESTRADMLCPAFMPKMYKLAHHSLWLKDHYSGSNCSQLGLFSLFYGRAATRYRPTVDAIPQLPLEALFEKAGYNTYYLSSYDGKNFAYMGHMQYSHFDNIYDTYKLTGKRFDKGDVLTSHHLVQVISKSKNPVFATIFLISTHSPYPYPKSSDRFKSKSQVLKLASQTQLFKDGHIKHWPQLLKYLNAIGNIDGIISNMIKNIQKQTDGNTVFIYTGDHAESFGEDGIISHASRASDSQMRVPAFIIGPNVPIRQITEMTSHSDILPTLAHILSGRHVVIPGVHGRDILSGPAKQQAIFVAPSYVMAPYNFNSYYTEPLVLVRPHGELLFGINIGGSTHKPAPAGPNSLRLKFIGFTSSQGQFYLDRCPPASQAKAWANAFNAVVARAVPKQIK